MRNSPSFSPRTSLYVGIGFFLVLIAAGLAAILLLNSGHFVYTLDDPYIHLRLAEQIRNFHYGLNANEYSSPSSSILWPFLLAPFSSLEIVPFLINIVAAMLTVVVFWKIAVKAIDIPDSRKKTWSVSILLILLILCTNLIGLVFTGMEHSLQVLVVAVIAWGLITESERNTVAPWLLISIAVAPLLRYENLAISLPALVYLFSKRRYAQSIAVLLVVAVSVGGFSLFLLHLGLWPLPLSVVAKSSLSRGPEITEILLHALVVNVTHVRGLLLCAGLLGLGIFVFHSRRRSDRTRLAAVTMLAIVMHLVAGNCGWYNRYEIYIWTFMLLVFVHLAADPLSRIFGGAETSRKMARLTMAAIFSILVAGTPYIVNLALLPLASNNILEQQYQMHRFAVDFYKRPVAVNDIGYVSYRNDNYVLDLYGLASMDVQKYRYERRGIEWMNDLARQHNVELAMIYENFFSRIPVSWTKIGELRLGKKQVTPAYDFVSFYALNTTALPGIVANLREFVPTLPAGVVFVFEKNGD